MPDDTPFDPSQMVSSTGKTLADAQAERAAADEAERLAAIESDLDAHRERIARSNPLANDTLARHHLRTQLVNEILNVGLTGVVAGARTACALLADYEPALARAERWKAEHAVWSGISTSAPAPSPMFGVARVGCEAIRTFGSLVLLEELEGALAVLAGRPQTFGLMVRAQLVGACDAWVTPEVRAFVLAAHPAKTVA